MKGDHTENRTGKRSNNESDTKRQASIRRERCVKRRERSAVYEGFLKYDPTPNIHKV
jgi:hypothetical protein